MEQATLQQWAPWPFELEKLVHRLRYRPGWLFDLVDMMRDEDHGRGTAGGLTFIVTTLGYDSYHPERGEHYRVRHYFPVPAATYNAESWRRWLFECLLRVEQHECCEFFALEPVQRPEDVGVDLPLERPYAPLHGPGEDPYVIHSYATDEQRRTRFTGEVR